VNPLALANAEDAADVADAEADQPRPTQGSFVPRGRPRPRSWARLAGRKRACSALHHPAGCSSSWSPSPQDAQGALRALRCTAADGLTVAGSTAPARGTGAGRAGL